MKKMDTLATLGIGLLTLGITLIAIKGNKKRKFKKSCKLPSEYTGQHPNELGAA